MGRPKPTGEELLAKIRRLPPERLAEVEDFVDFLRQRDEERGLIEPTSRASDAAFARVWDGVPVHREGDRVVLEPADEWSDVFLACLGQWEEAIERPKQEPLSKLRDPSE